MSLGHLPPRLSDAEALALGRLIEPELHAALVTVDAHGADLQLPKVRLGYAGHLQALRWIRHGGRWWWRLDHRHRRHPCDDIACTGWRGWKDSEP